MRRVVAGLVLSAGCGRLGFDELAGPTDAVALAGSCATIGSVALCEDFEGAQLDSRWSAYASSGPAPALDPAIAHRGSAALRVTGPAAAAMTVSIAQLAETTSLPPGSEVHVRLWILVAGPPAGNNRIRLLAIDNADDANADPGLGVTIGPTGLGVETYGVSYATDGGVPLTFGEWTCLQLAVQVSSQPDGSVTLTANGATASVNGVPTQPSPPLMRLLVGQIAYFQPDAQPAYDAWYDDIILDPRPHSCEE